MNTESLVSQHIFNILLKINIPYSWTGWGLLGAGTSCPVLPCGRFQCITMYLVIITGDHWEYFTSYNKTPHLYITRNTRKQFSVCVNWSHKQPLTPAVQGPSTSQNLRPNNFEWFNRKRIQATKTKPNYEVFYALSEYALLMCSMK